MVSTLTADRDRADQAATATSLAASTVEDLRRQQTAHDRFEETHRWRRTEIVALQGGLDHHWAEVIAACVRADDPLAYGIDRLRHARRTLAVALEGIDRSFPVDRDGERAQTRRELIVAAT